MNRASWNTTKPPPPREQLLPPAKRQGPARVLFIHGGELGFATTARNVEHYAATREDIDAVHLHVPVKGVVGAMSVRSPVSLMHLDQQPIRMAMALRWAILRAMRTHLPPDHFDVIHFMTQQRARAVLALRGRTTAKLIVNIDSTSPGYRREFGLKLEPWVLGIHSENRILQAADAVACASRWVSDSAVRDEGVEPGRVFLHKPCAIRDLTMPVRRHDVSPPRDTPDGSGGAGGRVRIAFVGNDWARKGGPRLIRWHQELWKDRAEIHVCSGAAPQDHSLTNVVWHGATPHKMLMTEILPQADMFVMPTSLDTFLIAAQEAQAVGLPVVTSRMAGIPEVVRHGRTGFLCNATDDRAFVEAIGRLIGDSSLRRTMGAAALEHANRNLSAERWHNHLLDQCVALADGKMPRYAPEGVDVRRSDDEANNPQSEAESLALQERSA